MRMDSVSPFTPLLNHLRQHTIILLGLGREGWSSYRFIRHYLPDQAMWLIDDQPLNQIDAHWQEVLQADHQTTFLKTTTVDDFPSDALIIKTPGLPLTHPLLSLVKQQKLPVSSNVQLFLETLDNYHTAFPDKKFITIGVTGTKGKSTTSSLVYHLLKTAGYPVFLGGNIGVPALDLISNLQTAFEADSSSQHLYFVLELSSHQLDGLDRSPQIAVIQNIVPEHLDYYPDFERYIQAKSHITRYQSAQDYVIFNPSYSLPHQLALQSPGQKLGFLTTVTDQESLLDQATNQHIKLTVYRTPEWIICHKKPLIKINQLPLIGKHNLENILPAIVIGDLYGLDADTLVQGLTSFQPLPHRLERVTERGGVVFYNDSLSTVPEATIAALAAFSDHPIVLIAGGYDRGQDFSQLAQTILNSSVKALITLPVTGDRLLDSIKHQGKQQLVSHRASTMTEAVSLAQTIAESGDVVLLSPASPSFGLFKDYQDRGNQFKKLVHQLPDQRIDNTQHDTED